MEGTHYEVTTFSPPPVTNKPSLLWEEDTKVVRESLVVNLSGEQVSRRLEELVVLFLTDAARLEKSIREARAGQYRPLSEVLADAPRPTDARGRGRPVRA